MRTAHAVIVDATPEQAFAYLEAVANETQWRQSVVGSRYVDAEHPAIGVEGETIAEMGPQSVTMRWWITEYEPGESVAWTLDGNPWRGGGSYRVSATPEGTRVRAELTVRVRGIARALEPILWVQFRKGLRGDLRRLAGVLGAK